MFLGELEKYTAQYEKGIKTISFNSSYPKILKEPIGLKMEKSYGNYTLYFNNKGQLLQSLHNEKRQDYKLIFGYDDNGVLIVVLKLHSENNALISISEFLYDMQGRIKSELVRSFYFRVKSKIQSESIHTYTDNTHTVEITSNDDTPDGTFINIYNEKNQLIEEKAFADKEELIYWSKCIYDEAGNLVKEISLSEDGKPDGEYQFLLFNSGQREGYIFKSKDSNYKREYEYTFNERGHWIRQVVMNDGEPRYIYERNIEYY